jgi:hypothetical protein
MSQKLTKCKSCEKEISVDAKTCPHCGAPNKKKLGCLPIIGISFGALFVIVLIASQFDGSSSGSSNSSSTSASSSKTVFTMNQPARAGHMEWIITGVRTGQRFSSDIAECHADSDETILVLVSGKVTNRSDQQDTTLGGNLHLVDEKGIEYGEKKEGAMVAEPLALDNFNPNVPKKFTTIFEIPRSARGVKFQATDFATFSAETALIDLALDKK